MLDFMKAARFWVLMSAPIIISALLSSPGNVLAAAPRVSVAQHTDALAGSACEVPGGSAHAWTRAEMRASIPLSATNFAKVLAKLRPAQRRAVSRQSKELAQQAPCGAGGPLRPLPGRPAEAPGGTLTAHRPDDKMEPAATHATNYRTVGKLFFDVNIAGVPVGFNCTASIINGVYYEDGTYLEDYNQDVLLTAAHCYKGDYAGDNYKGYNFQFNPDWSNARPHPYGEWDIYAIWTDGNWDRHNVYDTRYDWAFFITDNALCGGKSCTIQRVVDSYDGWKQPFPTHGKVTIMGVPGGSKYMLEVHSSMHEVRHRYDYRIAPTPGMAAGPGGGNGISGGPWFSSYNSSRQFGEIIGDTGGYQQGGSKTSPSYSDIWGNPFEDLELEYVAPDLPPPAT
jgi:hypothetical protein